MDNEKSFNLKGLIFFIRFCMDTCMLEKTQFAKDLKEKDDVNNPFLVKFSSVATDKNGKPYLNLVFMDKTGEVEAKVWDDVPHFVGQVVRDAFVNVEGKCKNFQGRKQIQVTKLRILREDEVEIKQYLPEGTLDVELLYASLLSYVHSMEDPFYKALAESILEEDPEIVEKIKRAPAAKSVHHAYPGGLLEHIVSITGLLDNLSQHYGKQLNRDLMFLGGFLHDIGKLWELSYDRVTDYTTEGKLIGHLVMGVELVERKIQALQSQEGRLPGIFPPEKKLLVKHLILAHHGKLEYGSPKRPKFLEALIVHYIDDLDSKINSIRKFIEQDQNPGDWTGLSKHYERFFFKGLKI